MKRVSTLRRKAPLRAKKPLQRKNKIKHPSFKNKNKRQSLIKKLDTLISRKVRERDNWTCVRCLKKYTPPTKALHCSHYYSRRKLGTRWDMRNLDALCYGCHRLVEGDKQGWYTTFKKKQLGEEQFNILETIANMPTKFTTIDLNLLLSTIEKED